MDNQIDEIMILMEMDYIMIMMVMMIKMVLSMRIEILIFPNKIRMPLKKKTMIVDDVSVEDLVAVVDATNKNNLLKK